MKRQAIKIITILMIFAVTITGLKAQTRLLTSNLRDVSVSEALKIIADFFGYQLVLQMPLHDRTSLELENATFEQAMRTVLADQKADYMLKDGSLHIFRPKEVWKQITTEGSQATSQAQRDPVISQIVKLQNRSANDVQNLVKGLDPSIRIVYDTPTNSLILMGESSKVKAIEETCLAIDSAEISNKSEDLLESGKYISEVFLLEHADIEEVVQELENIITRDTSDNTAYSSARSVDAHGQPIDTEYFIVDKARRLLVVNTTPSKMRVLKTYFEEVNKPLPQVLIEVKIVALDDGAENQLGINWTGFGDGENIGYQAPAAPISTGKSFLSLDGTWNLSQLGAFLNALETQNKGQILSKPRLMSISGQTASIHVGDEIPFSSSTTAANMGNATSTNVEFKDVGIKLSVTPTVISKDNAILLKIIPEVSQFKERVLISNSSVPQISSRKAESTIKLKSGDTTVIGGLIENQVIESVKEIPILGRLGPLGRLFRKKHKTNKRTNLIILLTARILDENFTNVVSNDYVEEIEKVPALKDARAIHAISESTHKNVPVYKPEHVIPPSPKQPDLTKPEEQKLKISEADRRRKEIADAQLRDPEYFKIRIKEILEPIYERTK